MQFEDYISDEEIINHLCKQRIKIGQGAIHAGIVVGEMQGVDLRVCKALFYLALATSFGLIAEETDQGKIMWKTIGVLGVMVTVWGLSTCTTAAQTLLHDDFNGTTINSSLWQTSTPFGDSSITASGGSAVFQNRGRLLTLNSFPTAIDIAGSFKFTGNVHENFRILTRTDGISSNPSAEFDHGIVFGFEIQDDMGQTANNIYISQIDYPGASPDLVRGTYSLSLNTVYSFRLTDDGNNLALYIGDLTTPFLTANDSIVLGNQVGIYNREGTDGGSSISAGSITDLDFITVTEIPEPSAVALLLVALAALLIRCGPCSQFTSNG